MKTLPKLIFLINLISVISLSYADINDDMISAVEEKILYKKLEELANLSKKVDQMWDEKNNQDGLHGKLLLFKNRQSDFFQKISDFRKKFLVTDISPRNNIRTLILEFEKESSALLEKLSSITIEDQRLLTEFLNLNFLVDSCIDDLRLLKTSGIYKTVGDSIDGLDNFFQAQKKISSTNVKYLRETIDKRYNLLEIVRNAIFIELEQNYSHNTQERLININQRITILLDCSKLYEEIVLWYMNLFRGKDSFDTLFYNYLQFEKPLQMLKGYIEEGHQYQRRVNEIKVADNIKSYILSELDAYVKTLETTEEETVKGGWEYKFKRQKIFNKYRQEKIDRLNEKCPNELDKYNKLAPTVNSLETFREIEKQYIQVVDNCKKRKK